MNIDAADIHHLIARYPIMGDLGKGTDVLRLFTADGSLELPDGREAKGHDALRDLLRGFHAGLKEREASAPVPSASVRHHVTSHSSQSAGIDKATATTYFLVTTARGVDHWGQWEDWLRHTPDGGWRLHSRKVVVQGCVDGSWFGFAYPNS